MVYFGFCNCFLLFQWNKDNVNPSIRFAWELRICFPLIIFILIFIIIDHDGSLVTDNLWKSIYAQALCQAVPPPAENFSLLSISSYSSSSSSSSSSSHATIEDFPTQRRRKKSVFVRLPLPQIIPSENLYQRENCQPYPYRRWWVGV